MRLERKATYIFWMIAGALLAIIPNFALENIIIPDHCLYHNNGYQTTPLFDLFYCFPPREGGHPAPTWFNYILTFTVGASVGWLAVWLIGKRKSI